MSQQNLRLDNQITFTLFQGQRQKNSSHNEESRLTCCQSWVWQWVMSSFKTKIKYFHLKTCSQIMMMMKNLKANTHVVGDTTM